MGGEIVHDLFSPIASREASLRQTARSVADMILTRAGSKGSVLISVALSTPWKARLLIFSHDGES